ncbi:hypothetical protein NP493_34g00014 [Ridgeia piscesae]|uniref:Regulator of G-protein signaling 3 n=1 Tax=Ridgeia piscesae TaxID=27915 RepID=A0AAD9PCZ1_RIDPI|nr:hypothetical protein NP493_34g00014 [Ridgeia piscesae]
MLCGWRRHGARNDNVKTMGKQRLIVADSSSMSSMNGVLRCDQEYPNAASGDGQETCPQGQCDRQLMRDSVSSGRTCGRREQAQMLEFCEKVPRPPSAASSLPTMCQTYEGQLRISIYVNSGLLTIHVIQARHLACSSDEVFVKLSLTPDETKRTRCKTQIVRNSPQPIFDEKFSFELLDDDITRRLLISLWHRPADCHSQLLGCMSFGIKNIMTKTDGVSGWYFLLSESVGRFKHLLDINSSTRSPSATGPQLTSDLKDKQLVRQIHKLVVLRGDDGFGFTVAGGRPAHIYTVEPESPADDAGVLPNDIIIRIDGQVVSMLAADNIAKIIRLCETAVTLEVQRLSHGLQPVHTTNSQNAAQRQRIPIVSQNAMLLGCANWSANSTGLSNCSGSEDCSDSWVTEDWVTEDSAY